MSLSVEGKLVYSYMIFTEHFMVRKFIRSQNKFDLFRVKREVPVLLAKTGSHEKSTEKRKIFRRTSLISYFDNNLENYRTVPTNVRNDTCGSIFKYFIKYK